MAKRRMFSLDIVDTDKFLEMPATTQLLYFHLGMHADDYGFISSPRKILMFTKSTSDDLKLLITKGYIIPFENGVVVIRDWKVNNCLRADRLQNTRFIDELSTLNIVNGTYELCQPSDNHMATEDRIGKDRIDKDRIGEDNDCLQNVSKMEPELNLTEQNLTELNRTEERVDYQEIVNLYNDTCVSFPKVLALSESRKKAIKARLKSYSLEDFKKLFEMAESSRFLKGGNDRNWSANFDWLIKDSNMAKVLEGNYENRAGSKPKQTGTGNIFFDMLQEEENKETESESSVRLW